MTRDQSAAVQAGAALAKRIICWFMGHQWRPYEGDFMEPYCVRCGKHPGFVQIIKDAFK